MTFIRTISVLAAALLTSALSATALPVLIDTLNISQFPSFGDGNVQSGISSGITAWNSTHNPDLPTTGIGAHPDVKVDKGVVVVGFPSFGNDKLSIDLPMGGYNYVFLHWGGPNVDAQYKNPQLYYIGDETGTVTLAAPINHIPAEFFTSGPKKGQIKKPAEDKQYGLSFYSFYSEKPVIDVPDNGASLALLGLGLLGIVGFRRVTTR